MTPVPPIATYILRSGNPRHHWLAEFIGLPMLFRASTEAIAIATAESWWESEQSKREARLEQRANLAKARAARKREPLDPNWQPLGEVALDVLKSIGKQNAGNKV